MEEEKCEQVEVEKCEEVAEEKCEVVEERQCKVEEKERCEEVVEEVCNQVRTWLCLSAIQMMEVMAICMETNIWAGSGGEVLCGGEGGMLFEGGGAVQGRDDWTVQPGAMLNIRSTYIQVTFSFLGCFIVQHYVYSVSIAGSLIFVWQVSDISLKKKEEKM